MLSIVTWNVNGIRACQKKGFLDWLKKESPQILAIQETKAQADQLEAELLAPAGYVSCFASARKKGYSGVAFYARGTIPPVTIGLDLPEFDDEGRTIMADLGSCMLLNGYFPNSQGEGKRLDYKLAYDEAVLARMEALRKEGRELVITGDFNAAHTAIDLANPKQNEKSPGFLPEERAWVSRMLELGWRDVFRDRHPGEEGHYTWWSYRTKARARNVGWRLDYFLVTPGLAEQVEDVRILADVEGSDHCPVRLTLRV